MYHCHVFIEYLKPEEKSKPFPFDNFGSWECFSTTKAKCHFKLSWIHNNNPTAYFRIKYHILMCNKKPRGERCVPCNFNYDAMCEFDQFIVYAALRGGK